MEAKESATATFPSGASVTPFEAKGYNVDDPFLHVTPEFLTGVQACTSHKSLYPTKKERAMLREAFVPSFEAEMQKCELITRIRKSRMIMKKGSTTNVLEKLTADVYLMSYIGKGKPTWPDQSSYKRIQLEQPNPFALNYRWTRVFVKDRTSEDATDKVDEERGKIPQEQKEQYIVAMIPMSFNVIEGRLKDLVSEVHDAADSRRRNYWSDAVNTLVAKQFDAIPTSINSSFVALHGHKSFKMQPDSFYSINGLNVIKGTARKLYLTSNADAPLTLWQRSCRKLFFPEVSVAEFMTDYLSNPTTSISSIADAMRGLKVRIKMAHGYEDRHITELDGLPEAVSTANRHAAWLAKTGKTLEYGGLPCVDVGTLQKHEIVPAEMCRILPMQSVGKHIPQPVYSAIVRRNFDAVLAARKEQKAKGGENSTVKGRSKVTVEEGKERFKQAFGGVQPKILFVEAGTTKKSIKGWTELCKVVSSNAVIDKSPSDAEKTRNDSETNDSGTPTLALRYRPGNDPSTTWKSQLEKYIKKYSDRKEKVLLVIAVASGEHHRTIYQLLKQLCDSESIGKQTFFVNSNTLEEKRRSAPGDGVIKAANEISRRMRIRNPPQSLPEDADVAIGLHITRFEADTHHVDDNGRDHTSSQTFLLVSTVSRGVHKSCGYHTTRHLLTGEGLAQFNPSDYIKEHLGRDKHGRVIILRSGYMVPVRVNGEGGLPISDRSLTAAPTYQFGEDVGNDAIVMPPVNEPKMITSAAELANNETVLMQHAVAEHRGTDKNKVSYILLEEEFPVQGMGAPKSSTAATITETDRQTSQALQKTPASNAASLFINGLQSVNPAHDVVKQRKKTSHKPDSHVLAMTLLGKRLVDPPTDYSPVLRPRGGSVSTVITTGDEDLAEKAGLPDTTPGVDQTANPPPITDQELEVLSDLFRDDHLELYDTKFPIPSYLAQAAAKRAMMHLKTGRKDVMELPTLPTVAPEVEKSLYFL